MKKGVKILIAVIAVIVVLGGVAAGVFFSGLFDYMKPARKTWSKQVQKALDLDGVKLTDYAEVMDEYKDLYEKTFKTNLDITADLSISKLDKDVQETINNSKIKVESAQNVKDKNSQTKITLEAKDSKVLDVEYVTNGTKFGIASKDLYDKYLTLSLEDLEDYLKKNNSLDTKNLPANVDSITDLYNNMAEINPYDLAYVSKDDLKSIQKTYKKVFEDSIDKKAYTKKANVKVKVDGKEVGTTGYYLTLSGEDATKLMEDLSNAIADDETLNKLIVDKTNIIMKAIGEDKISSDDVKELLKNLADTLKKSTSSSLKNFEKQGLQIAVYSKFSKPVRLEVNYVEDIEDIYDTKTLLSIEYAKGKDIYRIMPDEMSSITIVDKYSKKTNKERIGTLTIKMAGIDLGTIDYEIINKDSEKKIYLNANISEALAEQAKLDGDVNVKIEFSTKGNYKKEPMDVHFLLEGKYGNESAKINVDGTIDYSGDVSIEKLDSDNSTDILKLDSEKQAELINDITKKASEVLPDRLKLIGINVKAEDIYNSKKTTTTTKPTTALPTIPKIPTTTTTTTSSSANVMKDADTVITGKKELEESAIKYTEMIQVGFKGDKITAVAGIIEVEDEKTAELLAQYLDDENIKRDGKQFFVTMDVDELTDEINIDDDELTKENVKKALEKEGYKVD